MEPVTSNIIKSLLKTYTKSFIEVSNKRLSSRIDGLTLKKKLDQISRWYSSERLVFVLGAGVSASYSLPDWNTLLQKLLLVTIKPVKTVDNENKEEIEKAGFIAKTFSSVFDPSPLISARYLHNYFKDNETSSDLAFEKAIRSVLYEEINNKNESELLKEIRQFCIAAGRSPNLNSIITYNYDDLLEKCLSNLDIDIPFSPIYSTGMKYEDHSLPIYHVHGYLPQKGELTFENKVILSEDDYHKQYSDIYGWSNLIQINKFKDYNCLFIGLSFSDPNLRRILDIAKKERGNDEIHHYCFRRKYSKATTQQRLEKILSDNQKDIDEKLKSQIGFDDIVKELIELREKFDEEDAFSFGVGIVWVESYDEIPNLLKEIRQFVTTNPQKG